MSSLTSPGRGLNLRRHIRRSQSGESVLTPVAASPSRAPEQASSRHRPQPSTCHRLEQSRRQGCEGQGRCALNGVELGALDPDRAQLRHALMRERSFSPWCRVLGSIISDGIRRRQPLPVARGSGNRDILHADSCHQEQHSSSSSSSHPSNSGPASCIEGCDTCLRWFGPLRA